MLKRLLKKAPPTPPGQRSGRRRTLSLWQVTLGAT